MNAKVKSYLKIAAIALAAVAAVNRMPSVRKHIYGQ